MIKFTKKTLNEDKVRDAYEKMLSESAGDKGMTRAIVFALKGTKKFNKVEEIPGGFSVTVGDMTVKYKG